MRLFNRKKESCCCGKDCTNESMQKAEQKKGSGANVKILGSGCAKCQALEKATKEALAELGLDTTIEHITDFSEIAVYGIISTPALVIDEKVVSYGKVLKKNDVIKIINLNYSRNNSTNC